MKGTFIALLTLLMTTAQYENDSLTSIVIEKQSDYNSQMNEFQITLTNLRMMQSDSNLELSNWLNCLNTKNANNCSTIRNLMITESINNVSSLSNLNAEIWALGSTTSALEVAQGTKQKIGVLFDVLFYLSALGLFAIAFL